ncbi:MAG: hypothetical protein KatS3mg079_663 [Caloramator sp.]|nr:MAG: hypothetical protein KatS3mg079_663 [Caloramator sp.]
MGNPLRSMQRKAMNNQIRKANTNKILQAAAKVADEFADKKAKEIAITAVMDIMKSLSMAMEDVFRTEYGFGDKRLMKLMQQLNERLPDHLQFDVPKREKIEQQKLYDLVELLLELNCDEKKCRCKNYKECNMYKLFRVRNIPAYDKQQEGCPYKVTKGTNKFTEDELRVLRQMIEDRRKRIL